MDETRKYQPEWGNSDPKGCVSLINGYYPKSYRIPRIKSTELKKVNKQKGPSEDASIPLRRKRKAITEGQGSKWPGWKRREEGKRRKILNSSDCFSKEPWLKQN